MKVMFYRKYKNVIKRFVVIGISLGVLFGVVVTVFFIVRLLSADEEDVVINYADTSSVRSAEEQGIFSLEQGDIIIFQTSPFTYRVARLLTNNNLSWSVRRLEYSFVVNNQEFIETTAIPVGATQVVVIDVESQDVVTRDDVQFRIYTSSWHTDASPQTSALRAHGAVVKTEVQEGDVARTTVAGTLSNESSDSVYNVRVGVLAYNNNDVVGVGDAFISTLLAEQDQEVVIYIGNVLYKDVTNVVFYTNGTEYAGF